MVTWRFGKGGSGNIPSANEGDFARHVDYIHFNPVKHALVMRVRDWPYSSFHRYVEEGLLPDDWAGDAGRDGQEFGERK